MTAADASRDLGGDSSAAQPVYRIRFPRRGLVHIEGLAVATGGGGNDMGSHISYFAQSHCSALTRNATRMSYETYTVELRHEDDPAITRGQVRRERRIAEFDTPAAALAAAERRAYRDGGTVCTKCRAAATR